MMIQKWIDKFIIHKAFYATSNLMNSILTDTTSEEWRDFVKVLDHLRKRM